MSAYDVGVTCHSIRVFSGPQDVDKECPRFLCLELVQESAGRRYKSVTYMFRIEYRIVTQRAAIQYLNIIILQTENQLNVGAIFAGS